jgi:hypothetical protein
MAGFVSPAMIDTPRNSVACKVEGGGGGGSFGFRDHRDDHETVFQIAHCGPHVTKSATEILPSKCAEGTTDSVSSS